MKKVKLDKEEYCEFTDSLTKRMSPIISLTSLYVRKLSRGEILSNSELLDVFSEIKNHAVDLSDYIYDKVKVDDCL